MQSLLQREQVQLGTHGLLGELTPATGAAGLVLFARNGGPEPDRFGPDDEFVLCALHAHGLGTLSFDLSAPAAIIDCSAEFERQTRYIEGALAWAARHPGTEGLQLGVFGASLGAAAVLRAAADHAETIRAVVTRSGWPDLAGAAALTRIDAPTLLIVGGDDADALARNRGALRQMRCRKRLEVVPGASHRFREPGTLDAAAHLAGAWFATHLSARRGP